MIQTETFFLIVELKFHPIFELIFGFSFQPIYGLIFGLFFYLGKAGTALQHCKSAACSTANFSLQHTSFLLQCCKNASGFANFNVHSLKEYISF